MSNTKIVQYEHKYARALADMWNKSASSWGGGNGETTEESIIKSHENSVDINNFLAVDGEEVLGYCSFTEYREDEGALYIPLLNVRPDCHGKGIGRDLVLKTVERCIELGWPRLDLYTWPGNTKAVPLYKKCGFFWERRDDITHLMNFIPTVLRTEAVSEYFGKADWYADSRRVIEVKADGDTQNGFDYFRYDWEKDGKKLSMEFERRGRGLRLIETDDYVLYLVLETCTPVYGRHYKAEYHAVNKTGKPLEISIKGKNDKNIKYDFEKTLYIEGSMTIGSNFFVGEFDEEPSEWRTHPSVAAELLINGKRADFRIGVIPKLPVKLSILLPGSISFLDVQSNAYIEAENNLDSPITVQFQLPNTDKLEFENQLVTFKLGAKERTSIELGYTLKEHCLYAAEPEITCCLEDGMKLYFSRKLEVLFNGYKGQLWGEDEEHWFAVNGRTMIKLGKADNELYITSAIKEYFETCFFYPRLGRPYSGEFSKKKPLQVLFETQGDAVVLKAIYESTDFSGLKFASISKLSGNGILERYYEVSNESENDYDKDVWVSENLYNNVYNSIIPYDGRYIDNKDTEAGDMDYWNSSRITENWIFTRNDRVTKGISWSGKNKVNLDSYFMFFESNLGKLGKRMTARSESVYIAYDTFGSWKDFRAFATKELRTEKVFLTDNVELVINDGNPFVQDSFNIAVKDYKQTYLNDSIAIASENGSFDAVEIQLDECSKTRDAKIRMGLQAAKPIDVITAVIDTDTMELQQHKAIFKTTAQKIKYENAKQEGFETYSADNGCIKIKAAPDYAHSLFSMTYNGNEWLDSTFPAMGPKSWFNPWVGGIELRPEKFLPATAAKEPREVGFAELTDNMGNQWKGLRISYKVVNNEPYKGLAVNQYFLMLPGCPVLCNTTEILQDSNKLLNDIWTINFAFVAADKELTKRWYVIKDKQGKSVKYKCGRISQEIQTYAPIMHGSDERDEKLLVVTDSEDMHTVVVANNMFVSNKLLGRLIAPNGSRVFTQPVFYVFTENYLDNEEVRDLKTIKFV